jgi:hypothetical protein
MTRFIRIKNGFLNVDAVTKIHWRCINDNKERLVKERYETVFEYLGEGGIREAVSRDYLDEQDVARLTALVVPALPGYFGVEILNETDPPEIVRSPVIAWRISSQDGSVYPVFMSDTDENVAILCPDGQVIAQFEASYENVDRWVESVTGKNTSKRCK